MTRRSWLLVILLLTPAAGHSQRLDRQQLLDRETFWDNRDWDWYQANIPFFECPDADLQTTYYYRWEVVTKHLTYGSPRTGFTFTEFIDRPFWSGAYGAISCPAGHQLYEARWLRSPRIARDFSRYWFRTPGAQPRRYSTWLADAIWAAHLVHPDADFTRKLLPDLIQNYQAWEKEYFVPEVGLFWQTGHDDGMEININSRQTADTVRGAPAYRPTLNSYLYADALAIAHIAEQAGDTATAQRFRAKADSLKQNLQRLLWDPKREFFFPMAQREEQRDGHTVKARSLTHQTGRHAGSPHGREQIGYVPWQFNLPDRGHEAAWKFLMDPKYFFAEFGPTTVERGDPMFTISKTCCWWSGNSWPYATTQTLKAMANLLQQYDQRVVTPADYLKLLQVYARTHRKNGRPYIAEACDPDSGSWDGHDNYNHSEHYFHSGFNDLIITGLVGVTPRHDDVLELRPLAPESWDYFAIDRLPYRGHDLTILWDRTGQRYGKGKGLHVFIGDTLLASAPTLAPMRAKIPTAKAAPKVPPLVNFAVNNDGQYYPRVRASFTAPRTSTATLNDGNYWYHRDPPNRWTSAGSANEREWIELDFGVRRVVEELRLYFLDDGREILPPRGYSVEVRDGSGWVALATPIPVAAGRRATRIPVSRPVTALRLTFEHAANGRTGLTEIEAWGPLDGEYTPAPLPPGNLAADATVTASYTSRFDKVERVRDGIVNFFPNPANRWTSYESPNSADWLQFEWANATTIRRAELAIYDDRGGVRAPAKYDIQVWDGRGWNDVANAKRSPLAPGGGQFNEVTFDPVTTTKLRITFSHQGKARSGVSEVFLGPGDFCRPAERATRVILPGPPRESAGRSA